MLQDSMYLQVCVCVFDVCWDSKFSSKTTARPEGWWDLYVGSRECSGGSWVSGGGHLKCHAKEGQGFPSKRFWSFIFPPLHVSDLYRLRPLPCCQIVTTSDRYRAARSLPPQTVISSLQHIWWGVDWLKPLFIIILCIVSFIFAFKQPWLHGNEDLAPCHLPGKQIRLWRSWRNQWRNQLRRQPGQRLLRAWRQLGQRLLRAWRKLGRDPQSRA